MAGAAGRRHRPPGLHTPVMNFLLFADHDELAAQLCEQTIAEHASTGSRSATATSTAPAEP